MKNILVALSGGVDSAVSALLLQQQGYTVAGAYIKTWLDEEDTIFANCPWSQDIQDAQAVTKTLGIEFSVVNLIEAYHEKVVHYLVSGYKKGITPNPDLMCNREIKFGLFLDYALAQGFDGIATGHYCRRRESSESSYELLEGVDPNKDQSYFLALLNAWHLAHVLFPIGELHKPQVRQLAMQAGLTNAHKKDSQGICFLGKIKINDFLERFIQDQPGAIVNITGTILGEHRGLHRYTLGQRKGINIPSNTDFEKYVVIGKDLEKNQLIIAFDNNELENLYTNSIYIHQLSYINTPLLQQQSLLAKPRYRDPTQPIEFKPLPDGSAHIQSNSPQRALASGQLLALYNGPVLLGGGFYL